MERREFWMELKREFWMELNKIKVPTLTSQNQGRGRGCFLRREDGHPLCGRMRPPLHEQETSRIAVWEFFRLRLRRGGRSGGVRDIFRAAWAALGRARR